MKLKDILQELFSSETHTNHNPTEDDELVIEKGTTPTPVYPAGVPPDATVVDGTHRNTADVTSLHTRSKDLHIREAGTPQAVAPLTNGYIVSAATDVVVSGGSFDPTSTGWHSAHGNTRVRGVSTDGSRLIASVDMSGDLVLARYNGPDGGITDGGEPFTGNETMDVLRTFDLSPDPLHAVRIYFSFDGNISIIAAGSGGIWEVNGNPDLPEAMSVRTSSSPHDNPIVSIAGPSLGTLYSLDTGGTVMITDPAGTVSKEFESGVDLPQEVLTEYTPESHTTYVVGDSVTAISGMVPDQTPEVEWVTYVPGTSGLSAASLIQPRNEEPPSDIVVSGANGLHIVSPDGEVKLSQDTHSKPIADVEWCQGGFRPPFIAAVSDDGATSRSNSMLGAYGEISATGPDGESHWTGNNPAPHGDELHTTSYAIEGSPQPPEPHTHLGDTIAPERIEGVQYVWTKRIEGVQHAESKRIDGTQYVEPVDDSEGVSGTQTLDVSESNWFERAANGAVTIEITNASADPSGNHVLIYLSDADGSGPHAVTWPSSVNWIGGNGFPEIPAGGNAEFSLRSPDGGSTWRATISGTNFGVSN